MHAFMYGLIVLLFVIIIATLVYIVYNNPSKDDSKVLDTPTETKPSQEVPNVLSNTLSKHSKLLTGIQNQLAKNQCSRNGDHTECFHISRRKGQNRVSMLYLDLELTPKFEHQIKGMRSIVLFCRYVPTDLDDNEMVLFDSGFKKPSLLTLNRDEGTMEIHLDNTQIIKTKLRIFPFINSLSVQKIMVHEADTNMQEMPEMSNDVTEEQ